MVTTIKTYEGSIDQDRLDSLIQETRLRYNVSSSIETIRDAVVCDYAESDISAATMRDIVEIIDASGIE